MAIFMSDYVPIWEQIIGYLRTQESLYLLAQSRRSNAFKVVSITDNAVIYPV